MQNVGKGLVGLAAVSFVLAVLSGAVTGAIMGLPPESFARAAVIASRLWPVCSEDSMRPKVLAASPRT